MIKKIIIILIHIILWLNTSVSSQRIITPLVNNYRFNECDVIAKLQIISIDNLGNGNSIVHFQVVKNYKGDVENRRWIRTHSSNTLLINNQYIVYGKYIGGDAFIVQHENNGTHNLDRTAFDEYKSFSPFIEKYLKQKFKIDIDVYLYENEFLERALLELSDTTKLVRLYANGVTESQGKFMNNVPDGKWIYYFPNGSIQAKGYYKFGQKDGFWQEYDWYYIIDDEDAVIRSEGQYFLGKKVGEWKFFNAKGKRTKTRIYD